MRLWHRFPREICGCPRPGWRATLPTAEDDLYGPSNPNLFRDSMTTMIPLSRVPRCHIHVFITFEGCDSTGRNSERREGAAAPPSSPQPSGPRASGAAASGAPCRPAPRSPHGSIPLHYPGPNLGVLEQVHQIVD